MPASPSKDAKPGRGIAAPAAKLALLMVLQDVVQRFRMDPDGLLLKNAPTVVQEMVRAGKWPKRFLDAGADVLVLLLLPLVQPGHLRRLTPAHTEVVYSLPAKPGTAAPLLDVLTPPFTPAPPALGAPVVVFVHGGVWTLGRKEHYRAFGQRLAYEGMVVAMVGYTTYPKATALEQARQVAAALHFIQRNCRHWYGDPAQVYLGGHSSGAHVSALALQLFTPAGAAAAPRCAGLIGLSGVYAIEPHLEWEERRGVLKASMMLPATAPTTEHPCTSPTMLLAPPHSRQLACDSVLLLHGELDRIVPVSTSSLFACELLRQRGAGGGAAGGPARVDLVPLAGEDHNSFLIEASLGRPCRAVRLIKRFCGLPEAENTPPSRL